MNVIAIYKRDLSSELEDKIATLLSEFFHTEREGIWKLRFNLIWHSNPYLTDDVPACWIIKNDEDEICGFLGNVPAEFQYGNTALKASGTGPLYVSKKYAGIESSRLCLSFIKQNTDLLISSTPNDTAVNIFTKLRLNKIPVANITSYIIVLAPFSFMKYFYGTYICNNDREMNSMRLKKTQSVANNVQVPQRICSIQNMEAFTSHGYNIRHITSVSEFMSCLNRHITDNKLLLSRTRESLNWIMFSPEVQLLLHRSVISIWDGVGNYIGYCVFDIKEESAYKCFLLVREIELLVSEIRILKALKKYLKIIAKRSNCFMVQIRLIEPDLQLDKMLRKVTRLKKDGVNNYLVKLPNNIDISIDKYRASALDPDIGFVYTS